MLLIVHKKIYIQPIDISYIVDNYDEDIIPEEITKYSDITNNKFIELNDSKSIQLVLNDKNIIKLNDYINMNFGEIHSFMLVQKFYLKKYIYDNLYDSNISRPLVDKKQFKKNFGFSIDDSEIDDLLKELLAKSMNENFNIEYVANNWENYPLDVRNVIYQYLNINNVLDELFLKKENLDLTKQIMIYHYSRKELRGIYDDVINDELTKDELIPIKEQLQVIFNRMDYTPNIQDIIFTVSRLSQTNDISFINDKFMDSLLKIYGCSNKKIEQDVFLIPEDIYVIGYRYLTSDSTKMLEADLIRIKRFIMTNLNDKTIEEVAKYNLDLSNIMRLLTKYNTAKIDIMRKNIINNMCIYFYLKIEEFNYDYDALYKIINDFLDNFTAEEGSEKIIINNNAYAFTIAVDTFNKLYKKYSDRPKINILEKNEFKKPE